MESIKKRNDTIWQSRVSRRNVQSYTLKASLRQVKNIYIYISEELWAVDSENIPFFEVNCTIKTGQ